MSTSLDICYGIIEYDLHCTSSFSPTDVKGDTAKNPIKQLRISDIKRCSYPKFPACVVKYSYYSIGIYKQMILVFNKIDCRNYGVSKALDFNIL